MNLSLPKSVERAIGLLETAGFEAYAVGGCVRDALLGKEPNDWDITTSALPSQTQAVFSDYKTIEVGIAYGTVAVVMEDQVLEITTFRQDGSYEDHRHPDGVTFTPSLEEDLARRDFTVNAMAFSPSRNLVDVFQGQQDLEEKRIRCVGEPDRRFTEDALRILRGLRFAATLGFSLEEATAASILEKKDTVASVSKERITVELKKFLLGQDAPKLLREFGAVFQVVLPGLVVTEGICSALAAAPQDAMLRLALLLEHTPGVEQVVDHLRLSGEEKHTVLTLLEHAEDPLGSDRSAIRKTLSVLGPDQSAKLAAFQGAKGTDVSAFLSQLHSVQQSHEENPTDFAYRIADLAIDGKDLQNLGVAPGPELGQILEHLLTAVMEETLPNTKEALLNAVKHIKG